MSQPDPNTTPRSNPAWPWVLGTIFLVVVFIGVMTALGVFGARNHMWGAAPPTRSTQSTAPVQWPTNMELNNPNQPPASTQR
jgi:hypothetical protein